MKKQLMIIDNLRLSGYTSAGFWLFLRTAIIIIYIISMSTDNGDASSALVAVPVTVVLAVEWGLGF